MKQQALSKDYHQALIFSMQTHNFEIFKDIIKKTPDIDAPIYNDLSLLHLAVECEFYQAVELLLNQGANPNVCNDMQRSPLYYSASKGNFIITEQLLNKGANQNKLDLKGYSPLLLAIDANSPQTVSLLLKHNANPNLTFSEENLTLLYKAVSTNNPEIVHLLAQHGADVNQQGLSGQAPLHLAVECNFQQMVKFLLETHHAKVNITDKDGDTPLHIAVQKKDMNIIELLLKNNANINIPNKENVTPVTLLADKEDIQTLKFILDKSKIPNQRKNESLNKFLHLAAMNDNIEMIKTIAPYVSDINYKNSSGETALHIAASNGALSATKALLYHNANPNIKDNSGLTPLMEAARKTIYEYGMEINPKVMKENNIQRKHLPSYFQAVLPDLFFHATYKIEKTTKIIEELLSNGAKIHLEDNYGKTAFRHAISASRYEAAKTIYQSEFNNNLIDTVEVQDLVYPIKQENTALMKFLLDKNFNPNNQDEFGNTPLHISAKNLSFNISELLLSYGSDPEILNMDNQTVYYVCQDIPATTFEERLRKIANKKECKINREQRSLGPDKQKINALRKIKELKEQLFKLKYESRQKS